MSYSDTCGLGNNGYRQSLIYLQDRENISSWMVSEQRGEQEIIELWERSVLKQDVEGVKIESCEETLPLSQS